MTPLLLKTFIHKALLVFNEEVVLKTINFYYVLCTILTSLYLKLCHSFLFVYVLSSPKNLSSVRTGTISL